MRNLRIAAIFITAAAVLYFATQGKETEEVPVETVEESSSSDIPDRRDFPVNPDIEPCNDFYQYACSNVIDSFTLRADRSSHIFSFNDSSERLLLAKQEYLERITEQDVTHLSTRAKTLATIFHACMDEDAAQQEEQEILARISKEVEVIRSSEKFREFVEEKSVSIDYAPFSFGNIANQDDPNFNDLYIVANLQTLPERSYYDNEELMAELTDWVTMLFNILDRSNPKARAEAILSFEKEFAQTYPLPAQFRQLISTKRYTNKQELLERYPNLGLSGILDHVRDSIAIRDLTPDNFAWLNTTLNSASAEFLQDLYLYHALPSYMDDAFPEFYQKGFEIRHRHLGGPEERPERNERCTRTVMSRFTKEIDAELVDEIFPAFPTERFIALAERVREAIIAGISENTWLSDGARAAATEKMQTAYLQLVKPRTEDEWDFNPPGEYSLSTPYQNLKVLSLNLRQRSLRRLNEPRNRARWSMGPLTVNAYYTPSDNKFVMPIGILQYPFYDPNASDEVNLGAVGAVIGHELGHGIDDQGSRYDSEGRLANWMTDADLAEFRKRGFMLGEQFEAAGHNGELTLGENIGDMVGLTFAYRAAFEKDSPSQEQQQNFFLQYARAWCGVMRPQLRERRLRVGPHALPESRVNEQVQHQAGFHQAYSCQPEHALYRAPQERIHIW